MWDYREIQILAQKCTTESRFVNLIHFSDHPVILSCCTCHSFYLFNKHRHRKFVSFSLHLCENHPHHLFLFAHVQNITLLCWFDHHGNLFEGVGSSIERHRGSGFNSVYSVYELFNVLKCSFKGQKVTVYCSQFRPIFSPLDDFPPSLSSTLPTPDRENGLHQTHMHQLVLCGQSCHALEWRENMHQGRMYKKQHADTVL